MAKPSLVTWLLQGFAALTAYFRLRQAPSRCSISANERSIQLCSQLDPCVASPPRCGVTSKLLSLAVLGLSSAPVFGADLTLHSFKKQPLETYYWSEGAMLGDVNRDGRPDAVYGPYWWAGPEFTQRHEIYPPKTTFKVKEADGSEKTFPGFEGGFGKKNAYSTDNFFTFVHDFNGDGWNDVLTYGLPHTPAYLYINPAGAEQHWSRHTVLDEVDNESPTFIDLTGDGKPEIVAIETKSDGRTTSIFPELLTTT